MSHRVYFVHANSIRELTSQGYREFCMPIPTVPQYMLDYAKMLREWSDRITSTPVIPAQSSCAPSEPGLTPALSATPSDGGE